MKTALLLITLLWTALSFANDLSPEAKMELAEERIHTLVANSSEYRREQSVGREVATKNSYLQEFDQLMANQNDIDYLKLSEKY